MTMQSRQKFKIGDVVAYNPPRGIQHGVHMAEPLWFALTVPPQREKAAREFLRAREVYAFFPSETRCRTVRGRKVETERPSIPGHVYAKFIQPPQWDVMKERMRLITGVYAVHGRPVAIPRAVIRRLQGLTVEAEKLREARAELFQLNPGDQATLSSGVFEGFTVEVTSVSGGRVFWRTVTGQLLGRAVVGESNRTDLVKEGEDPDIASGVVL